jgi:hypothetical protein
MLISQYGHRIYQVLLHHLNTYSLINGSMFRLGSRLFISC